MLRAPSGRCYLPGGRIEPGEEAKAALVREFAEECGCGAQIDAHIADARQLILDGSVDLDASYWRARLLEAHDTATECEMLWLSPDEAVARLHRAGDRQAVKAAS